ncbi:MAG: hypothetical protein QOJ29_922 [Thermoleophilaceae bacterium]|jgi:lysine-specific demethylase 8|nr:hypothetical protein [Thermoleophilaceae bacterium]
MSDPDLSVKPRERSRPVEAKHLSAALEQAGLDVRAIPRSRELDPEGRREVLARRDGPTLFAGCAENWPASTTWRPEALAAAHGHKQVTALMDLPAEGTLFPSEQADYELALTFSEFLERMLIAGADAPCYLAYTPADDLFPPDEYDFSPFTGDTPADTDTRAWIGSAGTRSMLHSDLKDNLFCQIWGEKQVVLLTWDQSRAAYPFPDNIVNSRVDLAALDLDRFPRLREATLYAGVMGPGDILYMPRGCWHDIRALSPSVSLNHWFGPPLTARDYAGLILRSGPRFWGATARDFVVHGLLGRDEETRFFFSPPSTGKRFYDRLRFGDFSKENDPAGG